MMRSVAFLLAVALVGGACASSSAPDPGLEGLKLEKVAPSTVIPGTKIHLAGASFVDAQWGAATLRLVGSPGIDLELPASFVDFNTMTVTVDAATIAALGNVTFHGTARLDVVSTTDGETYSTAPLAVDLVFVDKLAPSTTSLVQSGIIFVNDGMVVEGDGFLLGGAEGVTVAKLTGCFTLDTGGPCRPIAPIEVPMTPVDPLVRTKATFAFSPKVAGIKPGNFIGEVVVTNRQMTQAPIAAAALNVSYDLVTSEIFSIDPPAASLGQFVFVRGGGFIGGEAGALTELELNGTFRANGGPAAPVSLRLIPEFSEGRLVRYVLNTDDELGQAIDLRMVTGQFTGTIQPIITFGADKVDGVAKAVTLGIAPVKQVVHLQFQPSYVEGLRDFGLRAVDKRIRDRIIEVCKRTYAGVNIDFRTEPPKDYALFENVELVGVDPNGTGLFGYDNSPGKDNGNLRLYDRLGGVNAQTQQDGYPGFGGVFVRSLMGFSKHPGDFATPVPGADALFDKVFDPFRADRGGEPIRAADLAGMPAAITDGRLCPASDRGGQIGCAVFVLGNLVGSTLAHEIGHSLGLANPFAEGFHNAGDAPNRLMDAGGDRSFVERAELEGQGPGVFCDDEYAYLRMILPSSEPAPAVGRPSCF